jgi:hypothetical protein
MCWPKVFVHAIIDVDNMASSAGSINNAKPHPVELFLIDDIEGFKNALEFKRE